MRKIFGFILVAVLAFPITACGRNKAGETGTAGGIETIPATDTMESVRETETAPGDTGSEPAAEEETIVKAEFDFERRTVMLNSGYEMPVNGLGTYSLHGDECINAVKSALSNGVRLIDTASAYGNEAEIGQAIHPYYQENDVIPFIQDLGIVVQERHPLGAEGIRHTGELLGDSLISEIVRAHGVPSAQVILR